MIFVVVSILNLNFITITYVYYVSCTFFYQKPQQKKITVEPTNNVQSSVSDSSTFNSQGTAGPIFATLPLFDFSGWEWLVSIMVTLCLRRTLFFVTIFCFCFLNEVTVESLSPENSLSSPIPAADSMEDPIQSCLMSELKGRCLISRKQEYFYRWCNMETLSKVHMSSFGNTESKTVPWSLLGMYNSHQSNGNTHFFMNGKKCPTGDEVYHAEVSFTCCPAGRTEEEILSVDEIRPCLWLVEVCTLCHCNDAQKRNRVNSFQVFAEEEKNDQPLWSAKAEKMQKIGNDTGIAEVLLEQDLKQQQPVSKSDGPAKKIRPKTDRTKARRAQPPVSTSSQETQSTAQPPAARPPPVARPPPAVPPPPPVVPPPPPASPSQPLRDILGKLDRHMLKERTKRMFYHGYKNYMSKAFPMDELAPISCTGSRQKQTAGTMLTLIDSLDSLVVFGDYNEFVRSVRMVSSMANFEIDQNVSVFETNIRILGGLLSGHLLALDRRNLGITETFLEVPPNLPYDGRLLELAEDVGRRLLPAFVTKTGIPYGTVNLMSGVPPRETSISSLAGAGSLYLELGLLSALTKNTKFAEVSRRGMIELFSRRNKKTDLLGAHIDTRTGRWTEPHAGIGSNADSFYEYLLKSYVLLDDVEMYYMFRETYDAVMTHMKVGPWYKDASITDGHDVRKHFNNLQAFWPGMQSMIGDVSTGVETLNTIHGLWQKYGFSPENYDWEKGKLLGKSGRRQYPLRPELIESVYHMHEYFSSHGDTTVAESWIEAGRIILDGLEGTKVKCGHASVKNVETKELEDNMPSFFLSETLKYLYLLFDDTNPFRTSASAGIPFVFSTEAHIFDVQAGQGAGLADSTFRNAMIPHKTVNNAVFLSALTCKSKPWWERSMLVFTAPGSNVIPPSDGNYGDSSRLTSSKGVPRIELQTGEEQAMRLQIAGLGEFDVKASQGGFSIFNAVDYLFVEIANLGGEPVLIQEGYMHPASDSRSKLEDNKASNWFHYRDGTTRQCFVAFTGYREAAATAYPCSPGNFGEYASQPFDLVGELVKPEGDPQGCFDYLDTEKIRGNIVVVNRGGCMFEEKALVAQKAGAIAIIIGLVDADSKIFIMSGMQDTNGLPLMATKNPKTGKTTIELPNHEGSQGMFNDLMAVAVKFTSNEFMQLVLTIVGALGKETTPEAVKKRLRKIAEELLDPDNHKDRKQFLLQIKDNAEEVSGLVVESFTPPISETQIPVIQVSLETAKKIHLMLDDFQVSPGHPQKGPKIEIGSLPASKVPSTFRQQHQSVLKGNDLNFDILTRGQWGVKLELKGNEWQLGITKRVTDVDLD
jgi:mannosidase alpha-like ER degradation enhancer 2